MSQEKPFTRWGVPYTVPDAIEEILNPISEAKPGALETINKRLDAIQRAMIFLIEPQIKTVGDINRLAGHEAFDINER